MDDDKIMQHYRASGELRLRLASASCLDEALESCLKAVAQASGADLAVLWFLKDDGLLYPVSWIGSEDLSRAHCNPGQGLMAQVLGQAECVFIPDYQPGESLSDPWCDDRAWRSLICVPLCGKWGCMGCVQLVKEQGDELFSEEDSQLCRYLAVLAAEALEEQGLLPEVPGQHPVLLSLEQISLEYKEGNRQVNALKDINLDLYAGEILAVTGIAGSGKSALLNIVGGLERPSSGRIIFEDKDLAKANYRELTAYRRDSVGFVFSQSELLPHLTVIQNIRYFTEHSPLAVPAEHILEMVELYPFRNRYPHQLREGQRRLASVARAMAKMPRLILADDPTAALEYEDAKKVLSALVQGVEQGASLLLITSQPQVCALAQRVIRLEEGSLTQARVNRYTARVEDISW